jgi:tetratricopeptide (TPR) repeat protein
MATFYSKARLAKKSGFFAAIFIFTAGIVFAGEAQVKIFAARAGAEFYRAQKQFQSDADNSTNAWQFARACYDLADFATNDAERAALAVQGIAACRQLVAHEPKSVPGHYYLAMNLGQLARTELLGALKLVREMEREFKTAADLDVHFDFAGPERCLGLLYRDAPGWPASIGSRRKAREFLEQAAKLSPDFPENILNLAESDLKWNERDEAKNELGALDALWPDAQKKFTGEIWERSWDDWTTRRDTARKKLGETPAPAKPLKNASNRSVTN